jgi:hypothetical protein
VKPMCILLSREMSSLETGPHFLSLEIGAKEDAFNRGEGYQMLADGSMPIRNPAESPWLSELNSGLRIDLKSNDAHT